MQTPIIVLVEYDFPKGDNGTEVFLFLNMEKAKAHGKNLAKQYLENNNLTECDFQGEFNTFEVEEGDSSYSFITWLDSKYDKYNVFVYEKKFEDAVTEKEKLGGFAMQDSIELDVNENETIKFKKDELTYFVVNEWGYESLECFLDSYVHEDTFQLSQKEDLLIFKKSEQINW